MQLDWRIRLALIIGGVVVIGVALAGVAWGSLDEGIADRILGILGALLAGLGVAGGPSKGVGAALILILVTLGASGCGAQCQTERTVVSALGAGLVAADGVVGDQGGEEYERASLIAHGAHSLGAAAVDACELLRDGAGWQAWVSLALEAASSVAAVIDGAGPADVAEPVPPELQRAIELLESEAR